MRWKVPCVVVASVMFAAEVTALPTNLPARLAIAWNDSTNRSGYVQAMDIAPPWNLSTSPLEVGRHALLRYARGKLYVIRPEQDMISVVVPDSWTITRTYILPRGTEPEDIAVVGADSAYVSGRQATHLLRLNLSSGAAAEAADFTPFADPDGIPDLGGMALHAGRLLVQIRRLNRDVARGFFPPALLAIMDVNTGELVDVDPIVAGVQAIQLAGKPPKRVMDIIPHSRRLLLSATGGFFDEGGIEMIDLDTLRSLGLVVHESHGFTGADTGPFAMVTPERGYLVYTTDLTVSSHLNPFTLANGPAALPVFTTVGFLAPALVFDHIGNRMFFANSSSTEPGVRIFDADGQQLTTDPIATGGQPSDLALLSGSPFSPQPASLAVALHASLQITGTIGATYRIEFADEPGATNWLGLTNLVLTSSPLFWADRQPATTHIRRFYRAVLAD